MKKIIRMLTLMAVSLVVILLAGCSSNAKTNKLSYTEEQIKFSDQIKELMDTNQNLIVINSYCMM